ncbi:copper homeostasis protein CutC [Acidisoma cellulosilytica]|uniref:PF03932 family protein CutC n=1 Tax=Acidisoma cellulosilyticum TaxID=2802395 RepID=A0A963Z2Z7_9PROT|nr:copper homeostasis protein CutC [Acidisoma cellulosilyticum]MCB8881022.1 copper homeostasis protein CutC [Acidisoma cellulosilyticum]
MSGSGFAGGLRPPVVEICVDDLAGALAAEAEGADRIELCSALSEGGLTPSFGLAQAVLNRVRRIGVRIMIRPRSGNFVFSSEEVEVMLADIAAIRDLPKAPSVNIGFVCGALTAANVVDARAMARLKSACGGTPMTFHKAFDVTRDLKAALETLLGLGIRSVLTSGGKPTAEAGAEVLAALVAQAAGRVAVIAGGSVRAGNVRALLERTGVPEVHLRAMRPDAFGRLVTSTEEIAAFIRAARNPA